MLVAMVMKVASEYAPSPPKLPRRKSSRSCNAESPLAELRGRSITSRLVPNEIRGLDEAIRLRQVRNLLSLVGMGSHYIAEFTVRVGTLNECLH